MAVVVGLCIDEVVTVVMIVQVGAAVLDQKMKTKPLGLSFLCTTENGDWGDVGVGRLG